MNATEASVLSGINVHDEEFAFNGIMAAGLCGGMCFHDALKFGCAGASLAVSSKGAQESLPYEKEICSLSGLSGN
ncbi:MAG: hypothetical protein ACLFQK_02620 [Fibrobacterota bacterium]